MTIALIDSDLVAYRCSASAENDPEEIALIRADRLLRDIALVTEASEVKLFLSGTSNFRYTIYPEYKANRKDMKRPKHLERMREYLVLEWGAEVSDGCEADDAIGIEMGNKTGICCSLDKDLLQLSGMHYNFVSGEFKTVDEREGWLNFYIQTILGDRADNIPGFDGKMRLKFPKFMESIRQELSKCTTPSGMVEVVRKLYNDDERLIRNGRLLYVWREPNDPFLVTDHLSTSEARQGVEEKSASTVTTQEAPTQSTEHGGTKQTKRGYQRRGQLKAMRLQKKLQEV